MTDENRIHRIAIAMAGRHRPALTKQLIELVENPDRLFTDSVLELQGMVEGLDLKWITKLRSKKLLDRAKREWELINKTGVDALFFMDDRYPFRLRHCVDGPLMIYVSGGGLIDRTRCLAVVGTRDCTPEGREVCESIISGLAASGVSIFSGLAFGIDVTAHRSALENNLPTFAVVAHGLDRIYPAAHRRIADQIKVDGGIISEYPFGTDTRIHHFPARNRIVAGCCDAVLVVESPDKGGSLITANIANSYDREVLAVPGRPGDHRSAGCNRLIRTHHAQLVGSADDVFEAMGWDVRKPENVQTRLSLDLPEHLRSVADALGQGPLSTDQLAARIGLQPSDLSERLLQLEFEGVVRSLPGKVYERVS